jgi:spore coat protein U-like protein
MKETWTRRAKVARTGLAFVALFGVALQGLISTPQGLAGDNAIVNVSANVVGTCKFNSGANLNFTLDPSSASDATATASLTFWCTKGATYTIEDDNGANADTETSPPTHRMEHTDTALTEYIPYKFCYKSGSTPASCTSDTTSDTGTGNGKNSPITLYFLGVVKNNDYINASAGYYSDTVTMTIRP